MLSAALLLLGCTGDHPQDSNDTADPSCFADAPALTIGSGEYDWVDLSQQSPVTMVHGPQGGWHMLGSARIDHTEPIVRILFTIKVKDSGVVIADNTYTVQMIRDQDCSGYYPGMYGYLDVSELADGEADTPPELLSNQPVIMEMTAEDLEGRSATASLEVIAVPDPVDIPKR